MKTLTLRTFSSLALGVAVLATTACNDKPETFNTGTGDPLGAELANATPVPPLPMIKASHTYRCKDNSLIFVDFMTDDVTAHLKFAKTGPVTILTAPAADEPYASADGKLKLEGQGDTVTYNDMSCKTG